MNAELTEIARRFVACPGWVWLEGMQVVWYPEACDSDKCQSGCLGDCAEGWYRLCSKRDGHEAWGTPYHTSFVEWDRNDPSTWDDWLEIKNDGTMVPDLDDPVTAAGILPVVRRAWGRDMWVREDEEGGYVCEALCKSPALMSVEQFGTGPSELLALLAALEAAPK